jgi:hypothetical protein
MNDEHDQDLHALFAQQRHRDHEDAPAWRDEHLSAPSRRPRASIRWISVSFATACIALAAVFVMQPPQAEPRLSELPPLFDAPDAELFAEVGPPLLAFEAPSDFLLPTHLNH